MGTLSVSHILVSESEKITYLRCRDLDGNLELFCIYDHKLAKRFYCGRWQVVNQLFTRQIIDLADKFAYKKPTIRVSNIEAQFVN